jgi:hypothetical protein
MIYGQTLPHINHVIGRFTQAGITGHLTSYGRWYLHRPLADVENETRRILSLGDLEFRFVWFLGAVGVFG